MISSETKIILKRSGVQGRIPSLADLKLGELGVNYYDGKLYFRQENETVGARIIEPGQGDNIGKTIFVTVNGNDNNSGLNERDSVRTIKKAAELAEYGDGIKVYPGQYIEDNPIVFRDLVAVEGMDLRNVLVTPANPEKDLYLVGDGFHATNHSFVSNVDSRDGAAIISFRPLEGTASDRYFDAARLIRDNLEFIASETVGFLTSGYSGFAGGQRSQDAARALELNTRFITEESFQYINSPDYKGPSYVNPDINQCRSDLKDILNGWRYDLISDGNSESTGVGLTYYAPVKFVNSTNITDLVYDNTTGLLVLETELSTQVLPGQEIKLRDIQLDCPPYNNTFFIAGFNYNNISGVGTVTLPFIHDIQAGDTIKLDDLKFDCPPYGAQSYSVSDFVYDETTGSSTVTLSSEHSLKIGDKIELRDLQFDCPAYGGTFTDVVNLEYNNVSGEATLTYADAANLDVGDIVLLYDIKLSCPSYGNAISITGFNYDNFTGITETTFASPHNLRIGDLVKFENLKFSCDSYLSETYNIIGFNYNNLTGEALATFNTDHTLTGGSDVTLADLVFSCDSYVPAGIDISSFTYDEASGNSTIGLSHPHGLQIGDRFQLDSLVFECNSYSFTNIEILNASYDNVTGFVNIALASNHGSQVGQIVRLNGLEYSCSNSGITTTIFPDGTIGDEFEILSVPSANQMIVNVGVSSIAHSYVDGGTATVGITTTVFPDGTQGFDFTVTDLVDPLTLVTNVGVSTIAHTYVGSGKLKVGFTTTVFPDGTQGSSYPVLGVPSANSVVIQVGVSTIAHNYIGGGTASNEDTFLRVSNFDYNDTDGTGLVTLLKDHNLIVGDSFILEDLKFTCDSYRDTANTLDITDFQYDNVTGQSVVTLASSHNLQIDDTIALYDIDVDCAFGSDVYPDGSRPNFYDVIAVPNPNTIITNVGVSTLVHTYTGGGKLQVGITTNIFPDGTRPADNFFKVISVPSPNQVITEVGISSIAHTYASGGKFYTGITTNIFPQTFEDPNVRVTNATYDNVSGVVSISCDKAHGLVSSDLVLLQGLEFSCASGGPGGAPGVLLFPRNQETYEVVSVIDPFNYTIDVGPNSIAHTYVSGGVSTRQNIIDAVYNRSSGKLSVTLDRQHGLVKGDNASVVDLLFSCASGGAGNTPGQLLFPRPTDEFEIISSNASQFTINVGSSIGLPHTYVNGGSASIGGVTASITNALYDDETGLVVITTSSALATTPGAIIKVQGLNFACNSGGPGNDPGTIIFPRLDVPVFEVVSVVNETTYVIDVGTSTLAHTYISGGFSSIKKKINDQNIFEVIGTPTPNKIITNVGVSSIPHTYVSGGNGFVGITTNIFPDGTRPAGSRFEILGKLSPNKVIIDVGISSIPHNYQSGGRMQYGETNERAILDFEYNNLTGGATVIVRGPHGLSTGDNVKLTGMEFECTNSPGITTSIFPDGTAASLNIFPVTGVINNTTFTTNVGRVAFDHTYIQGGAAFVGITTNIFPDGTQGYSYIVDSIPSRNQVNVNVGVSSIQHDYIRGGLLFSGQTNERDIANFDYDFNSGLAILTFREPEANLFTGDLVKLKDLRFECPNSTSVTTNIFPDGSQGNLFKITERLNPTQFQLDIGPSAFAHNYVQGTGEAFVGITTNIFPDVGSAPGQQPTKLFNVVAIPTPNTVAVQVGPSSIPHIYEGGGTLSVGINTDIFPGDSQVSPLGDVFVVDAVTESGELVINVGTSTITHNYARGGQVLYGQSAGGELQHITGPGVKQATIAAIDFEREISKYALNNRPWGSFIAAETGLVQNLGYDNVTGFATVTVPGINVQRGDMIRMSDVQFVCSDEYAGLTTTFFPDNTRPQGQYFTVDNRIDENNFETFIGISSIQHNYFKGGNVYRYRQGLDDISYDRFSGLASVTSMAHGYKVDDLIEMGDIRFSCPVFTPDYDIEDFIYDNTTGLSTVTTTVDNDVKVGDLIRLDDIELDCPPYGNDKNITAFDYNNLTGVSSITVLQPHGLTLNARPPVAISTAVYDNVSGIITVTTESPTNVELSIESGVQLSGLGFSCLGTSGITTTIFPDDLGLIYPIEEINNSTTFSVKVGVSTIPHIYQGGGDVTKVSRYSIKLADIKFDCPSYGNSINLSNFVYDNTTGNSLVSVVSPHGLNVGDSIKLSDIKFQCPPYGNQFDVVAADYDNVSGIITVTTNRNLGGINIGETLRIRDLQFDCNSGTPFAIQQITFDPFNGRIATLTLNADPRINPGDQIKLEGLLYRTASGEEVPYPDGRDPSFNLFEARTVTQVSPGVWEVQVQFINITDTFVIFIVNGSSYGTLFTGVTGNIFPEDVGPEGGFYDVLGLPSSNQFTAQVGVSTIAHTYIRYGEVFSGVTTNFFPSPSTQNSPKGNIYKVIGVPTPNEVRINVGISSITHVYGSGGSLSVGITTNIFPDGTDGNIFPVISIGSSTEVRVKVGTSTIPHNYISGGLMAVGITTNIFPSTNPQNSPLGNIFTVLSKDDMCPDRFTINVGVSSIPHSYVEGGTVTTGVTTDKFPDGTNGFEFPVATVLDEDTFIVNVGISTIDHTYLSGGFTRRIESPINDFVYNNESGAALVGVTSHRLNVGDLVKLRDIKFDCDPYGDEKMISGANYNNLTGRLIVTTDTAHGLSINETIKLAGLQMDCPAYGNDISITGANYDNTTGDIDVTVSAAHGLSIGNNVKLAGLDFVCPGGSGITTTIFPDDTAASLNIYRVTAVPASNSLTVNVGTSTIPHTYVGGGDIFVGITTNIFPGSAQNSPLGSFYEVLDTPSTTEFTLNVGVSSISHEYVRGGLVQTGVTTDMFPDGTQGEYFEVNDVISNDIYSINAGISSIVHRYNSGGFSSKYSTYQSRTPQVVDMSVTRVPRGCEAVAARVDQLSNIVTSIIKEGPSAAPGEVPVNVTSASYNRLTGDLSVTTNRETALASKDIVRMENLIFQCSKTSNVVAATYNNLTGKAVITTESKNGITIGTSVRMEGLVFGCSDGSLIYPANVDQVFPVAEILTPTKFVLNLEKSSKVHTWTSGGTVTTVATQRVFPDNGVVLYPVKAVLSPSTFTINVGPSDIDHSYINGGTISPGLRYEVEDADYNKISGLLTVTTEEDHLLVPNTGVRLNGLVFSCLSGGSGNQPGSLPFPDGRPATVVNATFNNITGALLVTTDKPHQAYRDAKVRLENLEFSCPGGSLIYPSNPDKLLRVVDVEDLYTYKVQLDPTPKVHTYVQGGTSTLGTNVYNVDSVINARTFTVQMAPNNLSHTYEGGGTVASVFCEQIQDGINLRTKKCAEDVGKIYLAVVHDITRGGNLKSVEAAQSYYDAVGQYQHIAGGEVSQTVEALDYSLNIVRCIINNVTWGGVPRGFFTKRERAFIPTKGNLDAPLLNRSLSRDLLRLADMPPSTTQSVVCIEKAYERGQYTTQKKFIEALDYNNITGIGSFTTTQAHRLIKYDAVRLDDIQMRCVGSPRVTTNIFPDGTQGDIFEVIETFQDNPANVVGIAEYNNVTGNLIIGCPGLDLDYEIGTLVNLRNLRWVCASSGTLDVKVYPTNPDYVYEVKQLLSPSSFLVNVGVSTIPHTFVAIGNESIVPIVQELPKKFTAHLGTVSFPHIYQSGGSVWKQEPFSRPSTQTQLRDVSIQDDPKQFTNSTPNACANVFSAIENSVGVVTTIIDVGFESSGIDITYPGNDGKGVPTIDQMASQGVGNIIKGPYIRNCTNFVPKSIGMRMDGFDAEPGDEIPNGVQGSSNVDSFTQFNPGGIGCSISNGTYQQLVSIFTICCDEAIVADSGAQLDLTNSNSSFGRLGLVARGIGDANSKCIDRYTGIVAEDAQIDDDVVIIRGIGNKRPYDGQGIFFGELYREVTEIQITDEGSGYDDENPPVATVSIPAGPSGIKAEVSPTVLDGKVVSIELISNGNQYVDVNPVVTIAPPARPDGRQAKAIAITEPIYYDVDSSTAPDEGTVRVIFKQRLNNTVSVGTTVFFSRLSLQIASSHSFEYIGSGNSINGARPSQGGVPIKANEIVKQNGGQIVYTSTDQAGNFNIGDDFVINQFTGTVTGRSFDQSVLNKVTPLIIALDS